MGQACMTISCLSPGFFKFESLLLSSSTASSVLRTHLFSSKHWTDHCMTYLSVRVCVRLVVCVRTCLCFGSSEKDVKWSGAVHLLIQLVGFRFPLGSVDVLSTLLFLYCALWAHVSCKRLISNPLHYSTTTDSVQTQIKQWRNIPRDI